MRKSLIAVLLVLAAYYAAVEAPRAIERRRDGQVYADLFEASGPAPTAPPAEVAAAVSLEPWLDGFEQPVCLAFAPGDPAKRLFVVEKRGRIRIVKGGAALPGALLDISALVSRGNEQGLLSVAFHPKHAENGLFYVDYTDRKGDTRVVEYRVAKGEADRADPASAKEILSVRQPYENHNGGGIAFDREGRLWVGMGDGGSGGDPKGNGQNDRALLGKMLRLDVDAPRGEDGRAPCEIRVKGVRNPWRWSFDRATGDLYIGDVGQDRFEEIDVLPGGGKGGENLGWNLFEGFHPYEPKARRGAPEGASSMPSGLVPPAVEYGRDAGVSVTGGYVYRGDEVPEIRGCYWFADYATGMLRSFRWKDGKVADYWEWRPVLDPKRRLAAISSFGEDEAGELYVISLDGPIRRFRAAKALR